ncbi:MAG: hypothetical protein M3Q08_01835 [Pseudomonadota bacterium]|nr:hypothetical protein [Pseudomonadota bacterium]
MKALLLILLLAVLLSGATLAAARTRITEGGEDRLSQVTSLGELIAAREGKPLHIIYVHGMRAEGPGASKFVRAELVRHLGATEAFLGGEPLRLGQRPTEARIAGELIWPSNAEWAASRPFMNRYSIKAPGANIIIHELNWWPLLFPLKCAALLAPDSALAGPDRAHLKLCARENPPYHRWLSEEELAAALAGPRSGGAAWPNGMMKRQILNWGLADSVIAAGPMRHYLRDVVNEAFANAMSGDDDGREYVVMSESLGSFVVLDAFAACRPGVTRVLERTAHLYFFANQLAMLELASIGPLPKDPAPPCTPHALVKADESAAEATPLSALRRWAEAPPIIADPDGRQRALLGEKALTSSGERLKQIVAFSDPSDMLSYMVPKIKGAITVNLFVRMTGGPLKLFADPLKAHRGHITDRAVWKLLMGRRASGARGRPVDGHLGEPAASHPGRDTAPGGR